MKSMISWQSDWGQRILNSRFMGITTFTLDNDPLLERRSSAVDLKHSKHCVKLINCYFASRSSLTRFAYFIIALVFVTRFDNISTESGRYDTVGTSATFARSNISRIYLKTVIFWRTIHKSLVQRNRYEPIRTKSLCYLT